MKRRIPIHVIILGLITYFGIHISCGNPRSTQNGENKIDSTQTERKITVNVFVESSGSMAGYCNVNKASAIETLITDFYDRFDECSDINNVTLNFINTSVVNSKSNIKQFVNSIKSNCTAQYTKLDEMLEMMMDSVTNDCVNILISDYVFTSNNGNLAIASSGITSQFSKQLEEKDLAVAIYKYMVDFSGKYYPGGISCNKPLPLYVWAFGRKDNICKIIHLPFNSKNCGTYFMQKAYDADFKLEAKSKRMIEGNKIHVSKWDRKRNENFYEFEFTTKLDKVLLTKDDIINTYSYNVKTNNSSKYIIFNIKELGNDKYKFTIRTSDSNPAPGKITISYPIVIPTWVEKSNFEGNGLPSDSTTYGESYLINGVSKAFENTSKNNNNYFNITINLE